MLKSYGSVGTTAKGTLQVHNANMRPPNAASCAHRNLRSTQQQRCVKYCCSRYPIITLRQGYKLAFQSYLQSMPMTCRLRKHNYCTTLLSHPMLAMHTIELAPMLHVQTLKTGFNCPLYLLREQLLLQAFCDLQQTKGSREHTSATSNRVFHTRQAACMTVAARDQSLYSVVMFVAKGVRPL